MALTDIELKMAQGWWQLRPNLQSDLFDTHYRYAIQKDVAGEIQAEDFDDQYINPRMAAALAAAMNELLGGVNRKLTDLDTFAAELINTVMPDADLPDWIEELADVSRSHIAATVEEAGTRAMKTVGVEISFDLQNRRAQQYVDNAARKIGAQATDTFRGEIRQQLLKGLDEGESVNQISKRIQGIEDGGFTKMRADRIARTETAFASTNGTEQGWIQSGVVRGKQFVLAPDACPLCHAAARRLGDGRARDDEKGFPDPVMKPLGQPMFDVGDTLEPFDQEGKALPPVVMDYEPIPGGGLSVPPVHPNCRCSTRPVVMAL